ncbi:MAG: hypothetical protein M3019_01835 [Candidatus Dormibacteraeota bacterium]|nr:hypothetical protein [Candidatus Dormibacteraeota bacterium]
MTGRGDGRSDMVDRGTGFGRRLRVGAAGSIVIGGAIFLGGAATVVTAFANTGAVSASQDCSNYSVVAHLDNNVANRLVIVSFPDTATVVKNAVYTTTSTGATDIFTKSGAASASGTVTEVIYLGSTLASGIEHTYAATLAAPSNCTSAISTTPSAGGTVGTAIHDSATVTGSLGAPKGKVSFSLFSPTDATCSGTAAFVDKDVSLVPGANSSIASSASHTTTAVGTYRWVAAYTPAANSPYKSATSGCQAEVVKVKQAGPTIATTAGAGGQVPVDVSDSATVSAGNNPTGTVTFTLYGPTGLGGAAVCASATAVAGSASTVTISGGKATSAAVHLTVAGNYQWVATYSGDTNNTSAASACGDEPVTTTSGGGGVQAISTPGTGGTDSLTGMSIGGFLLLGGLGVALAGVLVPRRRRS